MQNISMHTRIIFVNQCRKNQFDSLSYKKNMLRAIPDMARVFWSRIFADGIYANYVRRKIYNPFMDARVSVRVARCRRPAGPRDFRPARPRPAARAALTEWLRLGVAGARAKVGASRGPVTPASGPADGPVVPWHQLQGH